MFGAGRVIAAPNPTNRRGRRRCRRSAFFGDAPAREKYLADNGGAAGRARVTACRRYARTQSWNPFASQPRAAMGHSGRVASRAAMGHRHCADSSNRRR